jgi:hypothetical protein
MANYRSTSFNERKSPVTAAILAALPAIVGIALFFISNGRIGFSFVYGGLGMLYVGRWMKASLVLLAVDVVASVAFKVNPMAGLAIVLLRILFMLIGLPIWATRSVREYNELVDELSNVTASTDSRNPAQA